MNISSEIFTNDGSNSSSYLLYHGIGRDTDFETSSIVGIITILLGFPTNSYVIWLMVTGTGNGLAAEFFTLNLTVCEIFVCMESIMALVSYKVEHFWVLPCFLQALATIGHPLFQCLICVERYLAVVHPVTFLKFKPLRYRVIYTVIVWVAGFFSGGFSIMTWFLSLYKLYFSFFFLSQFVLFLSIQLYCCLAVLIALKQSGPGENGREREEENPIKRRAFYIILINAVTMLFIYIPFIILIYVMLSSKETPSELIVFGYICFTLAGLVQLLLFLYRVGKLSFMN